MMLLKKHEVENVTQEQGEAERRAAWRTRERRTG